MGKTLVFAEVLGESCAIKKSVQMESKITSIERGDSNTLVLGGLNGRIDILSTEDYSILKSKFIALKKNER